MPALPLSSSPLAAPTRPSGGYTPERIWHARRAFFESGQAPDGVIDDPVLRSWRRCAEQGRGANDSVAFDPVERGDLSRLLSQHHALLQAARPALAALAQAVADAGYAALLTDAQGRALLVDGGMDRCSLPLRQAFRPGVDLSEGTIGTSAMSAALAEQRLVSVRGAEHYFSDNQIFHCCAAPVFDPRGRLLGSVDVTRDLPSLAPGVLALVQLCARRIEQALFQALPAYLHLQLTPAGLGDDACLAFDADARLVAATPAALKLLGHTELGPGLDFGELFPARFEQAVQAARQGRPLGLALPGGVQLQATAQQLAPQPTPARPIMDRPTDAARPIPPAAPRLRVRGFSAAAPPAGGAARRRDAASRPDGRESGLLITA